MFYANFRYFFGSKDCAKKSETAARPEDAELLAYKEVCVGDEYEEQSRVNNTWSVENCPSNYNRKRIYPNRMLKK